MLYTVAVILIVLWLLGDNDWKEIALILAGGILVTAVLVMAVKFTIRRQRPEGEWGGMYRRTDPHSFPSGHAARAVMLAVVEVGLGPTWLGILLVWLAITVFIRFT